MATEPACSVNIPFTTAKSDAGNAGWQRDLSVSYKKVGNVQEAQGDLPAALTSYQASLTIMEGVAKSDTGNAGWQRDLQFSIDRIGNLAYRFVLAHDFAKALEAGRPSRSDTD